MTRRPPLPPAARVPVPVSWRAMLAATPRQNAAARVTTTPDGRVRLAIPLRRPRWLVPPLSWLLRPRLVRQVELDGLGVDVWTWCDGTRTVADVVEAFAARHGFTFHEARVAVTGYLKTLGERGALAMVREE